MSRPARAWIDLDALRSNLAVARASARGARVLAVVKADAYGHGAVAVSRAIEGRCDALGVACLEEAMELRDAGVRSPILLMEGVFSPDEILVAAQHRIGMVVHREEQLGWLLHSRVQSPVSCWLKLDTGMHRLGFDPPGFLPVLHALQGAPQVSELVLMTHLARADELGEPFTRQQIGRFREWTRGQAGLPRSLANSAALLAWPEALGDWVRPGIMLYGASPLGEGHESAGRLRPVMRLESELIAVRELGVGEAIGYGGRFVCDRPMRIGVVAIGYADGYPRHAPDGTPVAVAGHRTRLIGRVSMDMITLDLTEIPQARVGDPVELWGEQVRVSQVADAAGTISYQLLTGVSRRVRRRHHGGQAA